MMTGWAPHRGIDRGLRIAVGIATARRPAMVAAIISHLRKQTRSPDLVLVAAPERADIPCSMSGRSVAWIPSPTGLTKQRNCILREATAFDVVVFFDDDFLPQPGYLDEIEKLFRHHTDVVMATGRVIADGIIGPGLRNEDAQHLLAADPGKEIEREKLIEIYNGYGCNMSIRMSAVRDGRIDFDESLPLYGWLEDVDFSRRLSSFGRIVLLTAARGVHLGTKSGRQSGVQLGYSQIANPIYLMRKGSFALPRALAQMARNIAMNVVLSWRPEPYLDRRGRLRGNGVAFKDLVRGKLHPSRILALENRSALVK
jgi:glycosyltransferase involved in cell wall biosynthesis